MKSSIEVEAGLISPDTQQALHFSCLLTVRAERCYTGVFVLEISLHSCQLSRRPIALATSWWVILAIHLEAALVSLKPWTIPRRKVEWKLYISLKAGKWGQQQLVWYLFPPSFWSNSRRSNAHPGWEKTRMCKCGVCSLSVQLYH